MSDRVAVKIAIDLMHVPSQVRLFRSGPLPDGVPMLLRIAAGDDEAESTAALLTDRSRDIVRQAATFFVEQILFAPNADSYRVLGAAPQATAGELRRNVALLLRWLHPDMDPRGERSIFIGRVTTAWNDLKTPERRAAYDDELRNANEKISFRFGGGKSRLGGNGAGTQLKNGAPNRSRLASNARLTQRADGIGFFRRALSVLFHRPPY